MIYLQLFLSFIQIGLFSIGGGYAAMPLIQNQVVYIHKWITMREFTDLITISQMTPGPIAINSATFVGMRIAGIGGALVATAGCILPSCIIVSLLGVFYFKYKGMAGVQSILSSIRPAVVALIAGAFISVLGLVVFGEGKSGLAYMNWIGAGIFTIAFLVLRRCKVNPIMVMCLCGAVALALKLMAGMV